MADLKVGRSVVFMSAKMPLSHPCLFMLVLSLLCLPSMASTSNNNTTLNHHRYHRPATNAGLTHRSIFSPSVAAHRSRYLATTSSSSSFPRPAHTNQQTRLETNRNSGTRHGSPAATSSSWSPVAPPSPISSRNHPKFYSSPPSSDHTLAPSDRSRPYPASNRGSSADAVVGSDLRGYQEQQQQQPSGVGGSKGASMSKLDAMLSRLESTNDEMLEELQHERDLVAARRRDHHQERINRHQNRHRRPHRRHENEPRPNMNDLSNSPFNLAGTSDVVPRHHNPQHRRNNQHHNTASSSSQDPTFLHRTHTLRGDEEEEGGITRVELPHISAGDELFTTTPDQGASRNYHHQPTRSHHHRTDASSGVNQYYSGRSQDRIAALPSEDLLQDLVTPGEEEATFLEEADYQDEQAAKGRNNGAHQHHVRERDAQSLRLASENVRYVMTNARCASPVRRCIDLSVNQTVIGKKYWPRCAIVSRCGEESGCCYSPDHVCTVAESHVIDLYFFYVTFEASSRAGVDRLTFENHTKCECRPRPPPLPATSTITLSNDQPSGNSRPFFSSRQQHNPSDDRQADTLRQPPSDRSASVIREDHQNPGNNFYSEPLRQQQQQEDVLFDENTSTNEISRIDRARQTPFESERQQLIGRDKDILREDDFAVKSLNPEEETTDSSVLKTSRSSAPETTTTTIAPESCKCPEVYFPSPSPSVTGGCECICNTSTGNCRRLMKGKRYFKSKDEKCILSGECGVPSCKFGPFIANFKRCPRKREMKRSRNKS